MNDDYNNRLQQLTKQVNDITGNNKQANFLPSFLPSKINSLYVYIGIPIILFFVLLISRPSFILSEIKDEKTFFITKKINHIKLSLVLIFIIGLEVGFYFIINMKNSKKT
jgi:hypothetical protein